MCAYETFEIFCYFILYIIIKYAKTDRQRNTQKEMIGLKQLKTRK